MTNVVMNKNHIKERGLAITTYQSSFQEYNKIYRIYSQYCMYKWNNRQKIWILGVNQVEKLNPEE